MRAVKLASVGLLVVALAGVAWPDDSFSGGEFVTKGSASSGGAYTGSLKVSANGGGSFHVIEELQFASGGSAHYTADGTLAGDRLTVSGKTSVGILGKLSKKKSDTWSATFTVGPDGSITKGEWRLQKAGTTGTETASIALKQFPSGDLLVLMDPSGQVIAKDKKKTDGVMLQTNIDDDDKDGGEGGDGQAKIVSDKDDEDGVIGDDDLLAFKLVKPATAPAGAKFVLEFSSRIAVWRTNTKTPDSRVKSGEPFDAASATLYMEGLEASSGGAGETLSVELRSSNGTPLLSDSGTVWVARSAFLLLGHGNAGSYNLESWLGKNNAYGTTNPTLVRGKDEKGKPQAWAVYIWNEEKQAKIALATPGAVIAYDGHSNFGLGYAFHTHFTRVSQFMNIADAQVPVNWEYLRDHQDHPDLVFEDSEYADDASTSAFSDPVGVDRYVQGSKDQYYTRRWPETGSASGTRYPLVRGKTYKWQDYHYLLDNDPENARIVVKAGSKDMPQKQWSKLYLNSCYSGPYYYDSFGGHGTLFFTTDESASPETSAIFLESCIQGRSNDDTLKALNKVENINDYHVFGG